MSLQRSARDPRLSLDERLKILYPMVNEEDTPLPRCWSVKDKFNYIGLSQNYLRVIYKGYGKTPKDASSVRATHAIPASCGLYYYEVKIVSKGRDGYMGIGLSSQIVSTNRLPGWDKMSYGYHGDDGNAFCGSGTGQVYGPTFTTGDVIGCGLNLIEGSCFYTKNGHHLGTAFTDMPSQLYPTVGLQTPGEIIDANFGQEPFLFDIEGEMQEIRSKIHRNIEGFPYAGKIGEWQLLLNKMVCSYLVHHGYVGAAEAFAKSTGQPIEEDWTKIRNRQAIQKLVLEGKMGAAINLTDQLYPGFLQKHPALHFMLKVRQFIEMVGGHDEAGALVIEANEDNHDHAVDDQDMANSNKEDDEDVVMNGKETNGNVASSSSENVAESSTAEEDGVAANDQDDKDLMEVDDHHHQNHHQQQQQQQPLVTANPDKFQQLIMFGQKVKAMLVDLEQGSGIKNEANNKMLEDAFALLAYPNPWESPVGWQLAPSERENISSALNSTLLEDAGYPAKPPLEVGLSHAKQLVKLMANHDLGACAFANLEDLIKS
jgi:hypothetical protein